MARSYRTRPPAALAQPHQRATFKTMAAEYSVIYEQAQANWAAYVPDLPGCMTTGRTLEETKQNIREAIQGHIETLRHFGDPIPEPSNFACEPPGAP